jgi:hypothetical protein
MEKLIRQEQTLFLVDHELLRDLDHVSS